MALIVRPLSTPIDFTQAEEVQIQAWGMGERMVTPKEIMRAIQSNGGLVLGAFDEDRMVGMALSFLGYIRGRTYMYSHQTGVSRDYQSKGVGYLLKQEQRRRTLEMGLDLLAWTFDPLIARNLYFNLTKLGAIARNYMVDYYGQMNDSINFGWPTDRVVAEWYLKRSDEFLKQAADVSTSQGYRPIRKGGKEPYVTCRDWVLDFGHRSVLVDVPGDIVRLKDRNREEAMRWREATREVYSAYFKRGFAAVSLLKEKTGYSCLLVKNRFPPNIFRH